MRVGKISKRQKKGESTAISFLRWRFAFVILFLFILVAALVARMVYLTVFDHTFLLNQGNQRSLRIISIPAYRGMILDRNAQPLAISTPMNSVWVNPKDFPRSWKYISKISRLLRISPSSINRRLHKYSHREFVYVKRNVNPVISAQIKKSGVPGIYLEKSYKRFYPAGEIASQVVGFTNIDDQGQEGLELAYNNWLKGTSGKEKVLKDLYGHIVAVIADVKEAIPGHDLILSIDKRIQFLAYQVLKNTVTRFQAESGSVVVLNPKTGEILAMVNQPSFNPNNRPKKDVGQFRNRAVTDVFEPGSTMKVFSLASALDSGKYLPTSLVNTSPGWFKVGNNIVKDERSDHGKISVTQILQISSNVGVARVTLSLPAAHLVDLLRRVGFGERTRSGFPGEQSGFLVQHDIWQPFVLATLAFGYGVSVTPLQLAQAYGVIANGGQKCPSTFLRADNPVQCDRVMDEKAANEMLVMLESVLQKGGTGILARVHGYRVAGKTGTANIAGKDGYIKDDYMSSFVGVAPVSNPRLVVAVVVRKPRKAHYGAVVAAPAFAKIMRGALRILNIPSDAR